MVDGADFQGCENVFSCLLEKKYFPPIHGMCKVRKKHSNLIIIFPLELHNVFKIKIHPGIF